jgi:hypothetical protein
MTCLLSITTTSSSFSRLVAEEAPDTDMGTF